MDKKKKIGYMRFELEDYRESDFNEGVDCSFTLVGTEDSEIMSIEQYYCLCKEFAAAMGFAEKTINDWFGEY